MSFTTYVQRHLCHFAISLLALSLFLLQPAAAFSQDENIATPTPTGREIDRAALVAIYNSTNGDNWNTNRNWLSDEPIGTWHGVTTNNDGRVSLLNLWGNKLTGSLPAELGDLEQVQTLRFEYNHISGPIPPEVGNLSQLFTFTANGNQLSGPIPAEMANLTRLGLLDVGYNDLTCVPASLEALGSSAYWGFFWDSDLVTCSEEAPTATNTDAPTATDTATATNTDAPTATDTATATDTDAPTATDTATATNTDAPTATDTATATNTDIPTATDTATATNTDAPTLAPTVSGAGTTITVNATCSLADAITAANTDTATGGCPAGSGADTITISEAGTTSGTITLTAALPTITSEIVIEGGGHTISGNNSYRIFKADLPGKLSINNLTMTAGSSAFEGGAIYNTGVSLSVTNSTFSNNSSTNADGGAIYSLSSLTVSNSTFSNNSATYGGAIADSNVLDISRPPFSNSSVSGSHFSNNSASYGGAIHGLLRNVTVSNSTFTNNSASYHGGAISYRLGVLTVSDSTFTSNSAYWASGAIYSGGYDGPTTLAISNSAFTSNSTNYEGGAITSNGRFGGATLTISDSTFTSNSGLVSSGAIFNIGGPATITGSTFNDNSTNSSGGAIVNSGTLSISRSSLSGNSAQWGGAIFNGGGEGTPSLTVTNSTISSNSASNKGGGLYVLNGISLLKHVTLAKNGAPSGGGIYTEGGALNLLNSIVAGSTSGSDCVRGLNQNVNNLIQDNTCAPSVSGDPLLGTLTGSPAYYPLLNGSPAINAASADHCPDTDQAGQSRPWPAGGACDIGAYEAQFNSSSATAAATPTATAISTPTATNTPAPIPFNVTLNGTACHLHDAITAANGDTATGSCPAGSGADTITLTTDITLSATLPDITSTITIEGADHFISGNNTYRILIVREVGNLTINQLQLKHGSGRVGGAILNYFGTLAVTNSRFDSNSARAFGGAIAGLGGTTTITSSSFSNNSSEYMAGAVYTGNLGRLTVTSSTLSSNSADNYGGAIAVSGHMTLNSSKLNNNSSPKGGAIWNSALSYINNSEISNNSSTRDGGAIYANGNTLTVTNSTITGNSAAGNGGGVFVQRDSGSATLKHVTVANNSAANGGGVYREARATLNLRNSIVAGSTSGGDCVGGLDGNVNNLIQDNSCSPSVSGDPLLGTLTGSPGYSPLLNGSPAINAASADHCPDADQAGQSRPWPAGGACDIGAYEAQFDSSTATYTPTEMPAATNTPEPTTTPASSPTAIPTLDDLCIYGDASGTDQVFRHARYVRSPATYVELLDYAVDGGFWWPRATGRPTIFAQFVGPNPVNLHRNRSWHNVWEYNYTVAGQDTAANLRLRDNSVWLGGYTSLQDALNFMQLVADQDTFDAGATDYYYGLSVANNNAFGIRKITTFTSGAHSCPTATLTDTATFTATPTDTEPTATPTPIASIDRAALVALYNATDGDNWTNNTNWLSNEPIGDWYGVTTNADGRVTAIELSDNLLDNTVPNEIGDLSELRTLDLSWNRHEGMGRLGGAIPTSIGNLSKLEKLDLTVNYFTGSIPTSLGDLSNLRILDVAWNNLSGSIPSELGNLTSLRTLWLFNNQLSGSIPPALAQLGRLEKLSVSHNRLTGSIPAQLGNLTTLIDFYVNSNALSGSIPATLGNLTNLTRLNLFGNALTGTIPPELGNLRHAWLFYLGHNQLTGDIPSSLANLTAVTHLRLASNSLTGCIPAIWRSLPEYEDGRSLPLHDLAHLNLPYCDVVTDTPLPPTATHTATATAIDTMTATETATSTPTNTAIPAPVPGCINVGPETYWLFPASNFLSGQISVYATDQCDAAGSTTQNIGADGYVHTAAGMEMASAICNAAHTDGAYTTQQQAFNAGIWACQEVPPTATDTAIPSDTPAPSATNTPMPPSDTPIPTSGAATAPGKPTNLSALVAVNGILLSWTAPSDNIDGYQILRRRPRKGEGQLLTHVENTGNNDTSYLDTDVSGDDEIYAYRVKAIRAGMLGSRSSFINVEVSPGDFLIVQQEPTVTPIPPTNTPVPTATNTQIPPTATNVTGSRRIPAVIVSYPPGGPSEVQMSWNAPSETPHDYHVSWAKVGESFKTWTDLSGNAFPTTPSYTITGLDGTASYEIKVRARYQGSSGPWTTIVVGTSTSVPPTNTPVPPTNTPVPPSNTPVPSTNTPIPTNTTVPPTNTAVPPTNTQAPALGPRDIANVVPNGDPNGALDVTWTVPYEFPVDYRINWAEQDEPYPTWTDLSGNAFPTVNAHTITGLSPDVCYKVQVRARYGGSAGDWTEVKSMINGSC